MEPLLSMLAGTVTTLILSKVLEKAGEAIGEKLGEAALQIKWRDGSVSP